MRYKLRSNSGKLSDKTMIRNLKNENVKMRHDIRNFNVMKNGNLSMIPTKNRYEPLGEVMNWNDDVEQSQGNSDNKVKKVPRPPPIKITDDKLKTHDIKNFLNELQIRSFQAKSISIGIKVDLDSKEDYDKCIASLTKENISFFTHRDRSQKSFKVVLSGLPKIGVDVIVNEMKQYNIEPSSVTELVSKVVNPNHCLYLVQFNDMGVTLNQLRKIRAIDHIIVNWKPFIPRNKGPTQCNKCAMFGHGALNCHRSLACLLCASTAHVAADCNFNESNKEAFVFRCYNCVAKKFPNTDHRANDPKCPCRSSYLEIRNNINHKNAVRNIQANRKVNSFNYNQADFPQLNRVTNHQNSTSDASRSPTFAEQTKNLRDCVPDLYSMDELFDIFQTAIDELSACTTKGQQLKVLFKILNNAYE